MPSVTIYAPFTGLITDGVDAHDQRVLPIPNSVDISKKCIVLNAALPYAQMARQRSLISLTHARVLEEGGVSGSNTSFLQLHCKLVSGSIVATSWGHAIRRSPITRVT